MMENTESATNSLHEISWTFLYAEYLYEEIYIDQFFDSNSTKTNDTITLLYDKYKYIIQFQEFLTYTHIIYRIVFGLIAFTGLVGNILTVAVILRHKGIKSITDILVLNLAVTDILLIVFGFLRFMPSYDEKVWCGLTEYVTYACSFASAYVLVLISLDRYLALVHPIRTIPYRTKRNFLKLLIIIWSIVLLCNMPKLFANPFCLYVGYSFRRIFFICIFVFEFMLPLLLMCILYGHILKSFHNAYDPGVNTTTSRVRLISSRRVTKMVMIAMMVFIICRLPFHIMSLYAVSDTSMNNLFVRLTFSWVVECMLYLNCCINPIVFGFHSKTFRKGFRDVLRCKT